MGFLMTNLLMSVWCS